MPSTRTLDHPAHLTGFHEQQGKAVLPQVPPAPAAPTVVVVGQEGAAEEPPQVGLEADPLHQPVPVGVAGGKGHVDLLLPVAAGLGQGGVHLGGGVIPDKEPVDGLVALLHPQQQDVPGRGTWGQGQGSKAEGAHGLPSGAAGARRNAGTVFQHRPGMGEAAALPDELLHRGVEGCRGLAVGAVAQQIVDFLVGPVAPLVKGHGGADPHPVGGGADAVEHGSHVAVIPQVVGAATVEGYRPVGGEGEGAVGDVFHRDAEHFHIVPHRHKAGQGGADPRRFQGAFQSVPHKARRQAAVVLGGGELHRLLGGRGAGQRKGGAVRPHQPEIPGGAVVVQVFHAHRFQQKGLLVQLGVAAQVRRNAALQPGFGSQREIQLADLFGAVQCETAVRIDKMRMLQGESLLVVFLRPAGPDKLPLVFLWYHHTEISGTEKQQSGQKYQIHDIVQKNLFLRRLYEKNLTKSTRKYEKTAQERKCSFCAAADLTTI